MSMSWTSQLTSIVVAIVLILSGAVQPLLVTQVKIAGLGDPHCQLYMLFYYLGPALCLFPILHPSSEYRTNPYKPSRKTFVRAVLIAVIDIFAQALNYTGSAMAGPTIFAIIYSSVTVWTAFYSHLLLKRYMNPMQWTGVIIVFAGLAITAIDSVTLGTGVFEGAIMILFGSSMHSLVYVLFEAIMTSSDDPKERLDFMTNCAVQGIVGVVAYTSWQFIYTLPRYENLIGIPLKDAGVSLQKGILVLLSLTLSNVLHASTFFHTLKNFPGGATSAGIMKGVQAVMVFVFTGIAYCGRVGGEEMCFTFIKFISLVIVTGGVVLYAFGTDHAGGWKFGKKDGYTSIEGSNETNII